MVDSKYQELVADMGGGVGWRDLRRPERRRPPELDVEITGIGSEVVDGNFPWNLIKVETDAGAYGIVEAFPGPASEYIDFLEPGLTGQNPFDVDRLVEHMTQLLSGLGGTTGYSQAAVSGIQTALLDVVGKLTGLPVYQLLGGAYRDEVRIYADCHAGSAISEAPGAESERVYDPTAYAEVATDVVDEGFTALKFDVDFEFDDADTAT
jgi:galactonate dehydratase